jgi:hypothetical protein
MGSAQLEKSKIKNEISPSKISKATSYGIWLHWSINILYNS